MQESLTLDSMQESLHPLRKRVVEHTVYRHIETLADVRIFMEHHVFAVWDFMSLLKALQRQLTCVTVPWVPQGDRRSRRLINELVLAEESDEGCGGEYSSHFELYRAAMEQCGADTSRIDAFLDRVRRGEGIAEALEKAGVPKAARAFVEITWQLVESGAKAWCARPTDNLALPVGWLHAHLRPGRNPRRSSGFPSRDAWERRKAVTPSVASRGAQAPGSGVPGACH